MADPYTGEIRFVGFNFPPQNWMLCDGATLNISEYDTLYALIGTTYGGDGQQTFNLPDLRSRVPLHIGYSGSGNIYPIGERIGVEAVTLDRTQIAPHSHPYLCSAGPAVTAAPANGSYLASNPNQPLYTTDVAIQSPLANNAIAPTGGSLPHDNRMLYLSVNFIICVNGIYPSRD